MSSTARTSKSEMKEAAEEVDILASIDKMLDDPNRTPEENKELVVQSCRRLAIAVSLDTPIAVMKMCAVKKLDKRVLLLEVISLFDTLNARLVSNEAPPQPSGLHTSRHTAPASDLLTVESTTLQCLQMAITQDAFLSEVLLYVVHTHEIKLSPFSLALLLTMAHIRRHQEATLAALTRAISDQLAAAGRKFEWLGLKQLIDDAAGVLHDTDIERLLVGTAEQSLKMDAIRPYVTALAIRLIDSDCRKNSSDVARLDKIQMHRFQQDHFEPRVEVKYNTAAVNSVYLGIQVLEILIRQAGGTALHIIDQLCSHIAAQHNTVHFLAVLHRFVHRYRDVFFETNARQEYPLLQKLEGVVQQLTALPPLHALHFIGAVLPLLHSFGRSAAKQALRSQLLMLMKKVIFQPDDESRLLACSGILCLIEGVLRSEVIGQSSSYGLSQSSQSSQPSSQSEPYMDQQMLSELLAMLRRSLSASPDVRSSLYEQLTLLSKQYPAVRSHVLDLILPMFFNVHQSEQNGANPFQLVKCVFAGEVTDPLHNLFLAVLRCVQHPPPPAGLPGTADWAATTQNVTQTLDSTVERLTRLSAKDLGYHRDTPVTADTDVSRQLLMHGVYQAAMEWTLCKEQLQAQPNSGRGPQKPTAISSDTWDLFIRLFDRFTALDAWLTGKKRDGEGKESPSKKKAKRKKKRDDEGESTESEGEEDDTRSRATGKSQKSQSQRGMAKKKGDGKSGVRGAKKKVVVSNLLSPQALQMAQLRLLTVTNSEYPTQVLSKDLDLQSFLLRSSEDAVDRLANLLSTSCLHASSDFFVAECRLLVRSLWGYSSRLWQVYQSAKVEVKEASKAQSSVLALSLHAFERVLTVAGRHSEAVLAERLDKLLAGESRRRLELLSSRHGSWPQLPFHAHIALVQEQAAAHVKAERYHEANACLSLLSFLTSFVASDDSAHAETARHESGRWAVDLLKLSETGQPTVVKRLLAYVQRLSPDMHLWTQLVNELLTCCGGTDGKRRSKELQFASVQERTTTAFATAVCAAMHREMEQCEWLLQQTKPINLYAPPDRGAAAAQADEQNEAGEGRPARILRARHEYNEQCWEKLLHVAEVVRGICSVAFIKSELEKIGATLTRTLKLITLATNFVYASARNPSKPFHALMQFTVGTLCPATDEWQQYVTIGLQQLRSDESAAEMKHEARMLPELQKAFAACEAAIIRLSRAEFCRQDFTRHMQRFKARDFMLKSSKRRRRRSDSESEAEEESEKEGEDDEEESDSGEESERRRKRQKQKSGKVKQSPRSQKSHKSQKSQRSQTVVKQQSDSESGGNESDGGSEKENRPRNMHRPLPRGSDSE